MNHAIPSFLAHLKLHCGLPVPFTILWVNDVPDFRVIDPQKVQRCVKERLCAICGRHLVEFWFIGGTKSLESYGLFVDPPQHEECALYALNVCPFLSGKTTEHNAARPIPECVLEPLVTKPRSDKVGMRRAKEFVLVQKCGRTLLHVQHWDGEAIWVHA